ncbi:hypothetical protein BV898_11260 [Hypsibius exemplaris]|uniref:SET domain-containing protein n=1 Tax=Hypsibius exemplaris TaxID=2072580 RepID=A0A1W0WH70_HYPEX|nr:hypothetical protein BV898_11260 [Hypsibius exemplaris]
MASQERKVSTSVAVTMQRHEFGDTIGACNQKGTRTFNDLMSHESELLRQRPRLLTSYNKIKTFLDQSDTDHKICPDFLSFLRLYGRFLINNFSIYDLKHPAVVVVGRGIYLQPSVLDHSCQPNALQCSIGKTVLIKAIKPIEQKEDVRIAYMSPFDVREKRQLYLAENYFFNCGCPACTDPKVQAERNAMLCSNKDCHFPIPLDDKAGESCRKCGSENASQAVAANAALDRLLAIILQIQQTTAGRQPKDPKQYIELTTAIDQGTTLLYPTNFTLALAHKEAVAMLGASTTENGLDASMESLLKTIVSRRQHIGDYSYQPCFLVVKWLVDKDRDREAMALVSQVAEFFKTVAGETSVFYKAWCSHLSNL